LKMVAMFDGCKDAKLEDWTRQVAECVEHAAVTAERVAERVVERVERVEKAPKEAGCENYGKGVATGRYIES